MRKYLLVLPAVVGLWNCSSSDQGVPNSVVPEKEFPIGPGVAFRLAPSTMDSLSAYDSSIADIRYLDGEEHQVRKQLSEVLKPDSGWIEFSDLPRKDCRIDVDFHSSHQKEKVSRQIQIHVHPKKDSSKLSECDDDRILMDGSVQESGDLVFKPWQDAWIGPRDNGGNNNNGVGAELRLWEGGSLGVMDFGDFVAQLKGRTVVKAELVLHGYRGDPLVGDTTTDLSIDLGTVPRGWSEGNGNWYWFDEGPHNNYERAYALWPNFLPPKCSQNPASAQGIRWIADGGVREGFQKISTFVPELKVASYSFPKPDQTSTITLNVTESVQRQLKSGNSLGFGLRRATTSSAPHETIGIYSKDHAPSVSPSLVIHFAP